MENRNTITFIRDLVHFLQKEYPSAKKITIDNMELKIVFAPVCVTVIGKETVEYLCDLYRIGETASSANQQLWQTVLISIIEDF